MIAVTGASGFVGQTLCKALAGSGARVRAMVRTIPVVPIRGVEYVAVSDLSDSAALEAAMRGASAVVHLAGRAHRMREDAADPLAEFRRVNTEGTRQVFQAAAAAGVRRVLVASSVKAMGESASGLWSETSQAHPDDPYGISKREAELVAFAESERTGVEAVVLRFPLIYGPGAPANVLRLLRLVDRGLPLPLGSVRNRRSMLFTGNLVSAIRFLIDAPNLQREVFLLSDGVDVATPELIAIIAAAMGKPARLIPVPVAVLRLIGVVTGKHAEVDRLTGTLAVSIEKLRRLGWRPEFTPAEGWAETASWYKAANR